jgi:hypothetical protein
MLFCLRQHPRTLRRHAAANEALAASREIVLWSTLRLSEWRQVVQVIRARRQLGL